MKTYLVRDCAFIRLCGRYDTDEAGFRMIYSGAYADIAVTGSRFDAEIECVCDLRRHYVSFEVDGLLAQTFAPIPGKHFYTVFLGMEPSRVHRVRIIKETQCFFDESYVRLTRVRTDGEIKLLPPARRRIEFIGDSITAGEGGRGPVSFDEWLPMMFSSHDNFTALTAKALNADYSTLAISGWGVITGWDNNPSNRLPAVYDRLYGYQNEKRYDFSFKPDTVVIALGTNDNNALSHAPFTDPADGSVHKLTDSAEDMKRLEDGACAFMRGIASQNPRARLVWLCFYTGGCIHDALERAVERVKSDGTDAAFGVPLDLYHLPRGGMGSRYHPGAASHRHIARELIKLLR